MKPNRLTLLALSLVFMVTVMAGQAHALLKAAGAVDPVQTVPSYYLDTNNLALTLCTDQNGFCILPPPFDPAIPPMEPITTTGPVNDLNFPDESFYYSAEAIFPIDGDTAVLTFVVEAAFLGGVMPDGGIVFLRTDLKKMQGLASNATYLVTHPYGSFTFTTDGVGITTGGGGVAVRQEDTAGTPAQWLPPGMKAGTVTGIGPYLTRKTGGFITDPTTGHTYIGDPAVPVEVVGSLTGNNFARIERIITNGVPHAPVVVGETNLFTLMGRVFTGPIPSELSTTATYARDAVKGQVDIFATTLPGATLNVSGTGITSADMAQDVPATGKHFLHFPLGTSTLPTGLVVTNSLDLQNTPPHAIALVDEINITEANYNQNTNVLTVRAASRDRLPPLPTLTVAGFTAPNTLDANGVFTKTLTSIPPQNITVTSSKGGSSTAPVSVSVPDPVVITTPDTLPAYTINSLYNQLLTVTGGVPPYTWSSTVAGTLPPGINFFAGAGRLFGTPTTFGTYTFTLQVADSLGTIASKPFTITANTPPNPVAVDDTANATAGSTVVINVLANDSSPVSSLNPATVAVSAATGGSAVANLDGTVSYTAPATAGTYTFSYTVKDNAATPLVSNAAQVSVTVTKPPLSFITASTLPNYTLGTGVFDSGFVSTGGAPPYTYSVSAGVVPPGITVFSNGQLWGVPTTSGTYSFTITVTDNSATTSDKIFTLEIVPAAPAPLAIITDTNLTGYTLNSGIYDNIITASGGTKPYSFTIASGSLPPGLTVFTNGQIWGVPTIAGSYSFTATVTDANLVTTNKSFNLVVSPSPLAIPTASTLASYSIGSGVYNSVFSATGGVPTYSFASTAGTVPPGLTVFPNGQLWGLPNTVGTFDFTVTVTDSTLTTFSKAFTITIQ